jgi:hypothetical protein
VCVRTCVRTYAVAIVSGNGNSAMEMLGNVMGILDMDGFCIGG